MLSGAVGPTARRTLAEYARYHAPLTMRAATTSQMNSGARLALAEAEGRPWGLRRDTRVLRVTAIVALIRWTAGVALNGTCLQYRGGRWKTTGRTWKNGSGRGLWRTRRHEERELCNTAVSEQLGLLARGSAGSAEEGLRPVLRSV